MNCPQVTKKRDKLESLIDCIQERKSSKASEVDLKEKLTSLLGQVHSREFE